MNLLEKIKTSRRLKEAEDKVYETLEEIIDEREERGDTHLVDARELPMLKNLFRLRDIHVRDVMTPGSLTVNSLVRVATSSSAMSSAAPQSP